MDGNHDGTPLASWLILWDRLEEVTSENPGTAALTLFIAGGLISYRRWIDVFAISALVSWLTGTLTSDHPARGYILLIAVCLILFTGSLQLLHRTRVVKPGNDSGLVTTIQPQASSREATDAERVLEEVFKSYLEHLVATSTSSMAVEYIPNGVLTKGSTKIYSPSARPNGSKMILKVLTPEFYTRFTHYAHDSEAIFSELAENHTIWVDRPDLLSDIFLKKGSPPLQAPGVIDFVYFELIRRLRRRPRNLAEASHSAREGTRSISDIRGFRISAMDAFMLAQDDSYARHIYRATVLKLFVADRYFGRSEVAVTIALLGVRLFCWWIIATLVADAVASP